MLLCMQALGGWLAVVLLSWASSGCVGGGSAPDIAQNDAALDETRGDVTLSDTIEAAVSPDAAPSAPQTYRDLVYETRAGAALHMNLTVPAHTAPVPVVLWYARAHDVPGPSFLVDAGYAVANVELRYGPSTPYPAPVQDATSAVRFLRANAERFGLRRDAVVAMGFSKWGMLASLVGTMGGVSESEEGSNRAESSRVTAVINMSGHSLLVGEDPMKNAEFLGYDPAQCAVNPPPCAALERRASAQTYVSADDPPFLLMRGTLDRVVPERQLTELQRALAAVAVPVQFLAVDGVGHDAEALLAAPQQPLVLEFLATRLPR